GDSYGTIKAMTLTGAKLPPPTFSVVIPLYNRRRTIAATVESVQRQSCQDFEVIIVDDGSTDDPFPVIQAIGESRLRTIRRENGGGGAARNTGIDAARGRYVAFLDSDDELLPHHLEQAYVFLNEFPNTCTFT